MSSSLFPVVLVETSENLNTGSVVRAMGNFGFEDLRLVNPQAFDSKRVSITACNANYLIEKIQLFENLKDSISDVEDVIGFSARSGNDRCEVSLNEWLQEIKSKGLRKTALLFGPEDAGLRVEHLEQCRLHVHIPTNNRCPSLNLAQAVILVLFEIRKLLTCNKDNSLQNITIKDLPTNKEFQQLDKLIEEALMLSEFYHKGTPGPVPRVVKNMIRRIEPNSREMGILLGIFGKISKSLKDNI